MGNIPIFFIFFSLSFLIQDSFGEVCEDVGVICLCNPDNVPGVKCNDTTLNEAVSFANPGDVIYLMEPDVFVTSTVEIEVEKYNLKVFAGSGVNVEITCLVPVADACFEISAPGVVFSGELGSFKITQVQSQAEYFLGFSFDFKAIDIVFEGWGLYGHTMPVKGLIEIPHDILEVPRIEFIRCVFDQMGLDLEHRNGRVPSVRIEDCRFDSMASLRVYRFFCDLEERECVITKNYFDQLWHQEANNDDRQYILQMEQCEGFYIENNIFERTDFDRTYYGFIDFSIDGGEPGYRQNKDIMIQNNLFLCTSGNPLEVVIDGHCKGTDTQACIRDPTSLSNVGVYNNIFYGSCHTRTSRVVIYNQLGMDICAENCEVKYNHFGGPGSQCLVANPNNPTENITLGKIIDLATAELDLVTFLIEKNWCNDSMQIPLTLQGERPWPFYEPTAEIYGEVIIGLSPTEDFINRPRQNEEVTRKPNTEITAGPYEYQCPHSYRGVGCLEYYCVESAYLDPTTLCTTCLPRLDEGFDCEECTNYWSNFPDCNLCEHAVLRDANCLNCLDELLDPTQNCLVALPSTGNNTIVVNNTITTEGGLSPLATLGIVLGIVGFVLCVLVIGAVSTTVAGVVIYRQRKKLVKFDELDDVDLLLEEQRVAKDVNIAHLNINENLFKIKYSDLKIITKIGQGGSNAMVMKCEFQNQLCAFKCFPTSMITTQDGIFREFENEVALLGSLAHSNILRFMVGIVMEFAENGDIKSFLKKFKREEEGFSFKLAGKVRMVSEIASALQYCHSKNVVHRDIKEENVLVTRNLDTRLMDFGISRIIESMDQTKTRCVGTSQYMSPEVCLGSNYSSKADVYSLAKNWKPYGNVMQIELKVASDPSCRPEVSPEIVSERFQNSTSLVSLMQKMWHHDPNVRPDCKEIFLELKKIAREIAETSSSQSSLTNNPAEGTGMAGANTRIEELERMVADLKGQIYQRDNLVAQLRDQNSQLSFSIQQLQSSDGNAMKKKSIDM